MGLFSWKTCDTEESIPVDGSDRFNPERPVYFLMPKEMSSQNLREEAYEGYGVFWGVDAYWWLAKVNHTTEELEGKTPDQMRTMGIDLYFSDRYKDAKYQLKFSFDPDAVYEEHPSSLDCPDQGFLYDNLEWD